MALTVTVARVKEKCGLSGSTYDSTIGNLIAEVLPAVEFAVRAEHLGEVSNVGLQATLTLAATEIVCGELLEQMAREPGAIETVRIGGLELEPPAAKLFAGALELRARGWERLRPFLKPDVSGRLGGVGTSTALTGTSSGSE